jgi:PKHD-type hydroxylase
MIHVIPDALSGDALQRCRAMLASVPWADGRHTAGTQAAQVKNNRQLPEDDPTGLELRAIVLAALSRNAQFFTAALPRQIYPPLFNRYGGTQNAFGDHVDNAVRTHPPTARHVRTDLSFTLFLSDPDEYEGGELVIEDGLRGTPIKLPAGQLVLYPSYSVHRVEPVTRGARLACFSWVQSMVRETERRELLYALDLSIIALRREPCDSPEVVRLTSCYHNLLRMWADV